MNRNIDVELSGKKKRKKSPPKTKGKKISKTF